MPQSGPYRRHEASSCRIGLAALFEDMPRVTSASAPPFTSEGATCRDSALRVRLIHSLA